MVPALEIDKNVTFPETKQQVVEAKKAKKLRLGARTGSLGGGSSVRGLVVGGATRCFGRSETAAAAGAALRRSITVTQRVQRTGRSDVIATCFQRKLHVTFRLSLRQSL